MKRVLVNGLAGVVIIAGVGSVITMAIVTGVKLAYADTGSMELDHGKQVNLAYTYEEEFSLDRYTELDRM